MKQSFSKFSLAIALLLITACAQTTGPAANPSTPCPCCQKMHKDGDMKKCCCKDMGEGKQCPMHGKGHHSDMSSPNDKH